MVNVQFFIWIKIMHQSSQNATYKIVENAISKTLCKDWEWVTIFVGSIRPFAPLARRETLLSIGNGIESRFCRRRQIASQIRDKSKVTIFFYPSLPSPSSTLRLVWDMSNAK